MSGLFDEQAEQLNLALYAPQSDRSFDDSPAPPAPSAEDAAAALANRLTLLGQALAGAGLADADFPSALARADQSAMAPHQLAAVIDGLAAVWGDRNKIQSQMHEMQSDMDRLRSDLMYSNQRCAVLKEEKAEAEKLKWEIEMKRRTAEKEALAREKSLKAELSALEKKCVMIQRRDNQYRHELRKSEMNFEKIQDKLHKLVLERSGTPGAKGVAQGGWELSSTIKAGATRGRGAAGAASSMLGDSHALPTSSADIELLQSTLSTYSERMNELVGENLALKAAMRSLEGEVQRVLTEQAEAAGEEGEQSALERELAAADADAAAASSPSAPALDADGNPVSPSAGPASNSTGRCLSPTTLSLLSDFHPSQIELPWDLVGRSVEKVLHGKLALLRAGVAAARARQSRALDAQWEESVLDALKAKVGEQAAIIQGQDQLLQQVLFAQQSDALVAEEERECRRLSMRAEADDLARRRAASQADTPALLLSASKPRSAAAAAAAHHSHQSWAASPASLRILGGHTANNLPVFATPAFVRKQPQSHSQSGAPLSVSTESGASAAAAASSDFISPSSAHSIPLNSKSKWHAGGVLTTPTFTPSRRSGVRPRAGTLDEESDLSRIHASGLDDDEVDDDDAAIDLDDDDEAALSPVPIDITAGLDSMPPTPSAPLTSTHAHA